ncbi:ATP adenylyltransferase family protein [Myxacorys almedinensis]|uniref:Phosphorylase n=1 Tax=Myxacorys almedinensis A TaxID=2690445 RepID=A0A8J7Z3B3_9CYAN|nr:phosphorylase [Myxacorys almedinensis]NDJ18520.1 phosphorylase [Myxacorys almedinensis A]
MFEPPQLTLLTHPGILWERAIAQTRSAIASGALRSVPTERGFIHDEGVQFLVRVLTNLIRKDAATQAQITAETTTGKSFNPFLPYEDDLFVVDVSPTHVCLLNKFNVADHHLLVITRAFEEQESWLTFNDFAALWACLAEFDGLAFYNGGKTAGASQRHKHLQLVPFPLVPESRLPIACLLSSATLTPPNNVPGLPFLHAFAPLDPSWARSPAKAADLTLSCYNRLFQSLGWQPSTGNTPMQSGAYNLLMTRDWMLVVPRSRESTHNISVNSLGFAGALLVRSEAELNLLTKIRPMNLLRQVAFPLS